MYIDEVREVFGPNDPGKRRARCGIVFTDGKNLMLDLSLSEYDVFLQAVQQAVVAIRHPIAREQLLQSAVQFGPVRLTTETINLGSKTREWEEVEKVFVGSGALGLRTRNGQSDSCKLKDIPNYVVLWALLRERLGDRCERT